MLIQEGGRSGGQRGRSVQRAQPGARNANLGGGREPGTRCPRVFWGSHPGRQRPRRGCRENRGGLHLYARAGMACDIATWFSDADQLPGCQALQRGSLLPLDIPTCYSRTAAIPSGRGDEQNEKRMTWKPKKGGITRE